MARRATIRPRVVTAPSADPVSSRVADVDVNRVDLIVARRGARRCRVSALKSALPRNEREAQGRGDGALDRLHELGHVANSWRRRGVSMWRCSKRATTRALAVHEHERPRLGDGGLEEGDHVRG